MDAEEEAMSVTYDEFDFLKNKVAELRRRIEGIERVLLRTIDRVVALERLEREREELTS